MRTITRRTGNTYTITTHDKNPATGKVDVLATVSEDYRNWWRLHLDMPQHYIPACVVPQPILEEAKDYFAACVLDENRQIMHPDVCNECGGFIPADQPECPACVAFRERQAEGKRRLERMFPGNPPEVTAAFEEGERLGEQILHDLHDAENTLVTFR